jgi:hypothetical protein
MVNPARLMVATSLRFSLSIIATKYGDHLQQLWIADYR